MHVDFRLPVLFDKPAGNRVAIFGAAIGQQISIDL